MRSGRLQDRSKLAAIKAYACFGSIRAYLHGPPGREIVPYIGFICMCRAKGYVFFSHFGGEIEYQFRPFWSAIGYGLCTLVLNWVCFLKELATSSSFGDKTISLLMFKPTTVYVP